MLMDSSNIDELLTRYWNCETSLEEEEQLRRYFTGGQVPDHLRETAVLFRYFEEGKKKSLQDPAFEKEITQKLGTPKRSRSVNLFYNTMRIAAGVTVLMLAIWFVRREVRTTTPQEVVDTYNDPQLAFEETKKALMIISKSFGQAETQAKKINLFNEAQEEIQKGTETESKL